MPILGTLISVGGEDVQSDRGGGGRVGGGDVVVRRARCGCVVGDVGSTRPAADAAGRGAGA